VDDITLVKVCNSVEDDPDEICGILFIVVALGADTIIERPAGAKIEAEVEIEGGLEIIV